VASSSAPAGRPYINLPGGLAPGQSVTLTLWFTKKDIWALSYTAQVVAGIGTR